MQVVDKFWGLREYVLATSDDELLQHMQPLYRATAILSESDGKWVYGGCNREAEEALRQDLKDAQALAEENGLAAKEEQSRANELDAQLVLRYSSYVCDKRISSCYKNLRQSQPMFSDVVCEVGGHEAGPYHLKWLRTKLYLPACSCAHYMLVEAICFSIVSG